jgi:hypothetical protein
MSHPDIRQSREYQAPFIRIRGRVSRRGEVRWSPCLRTDKGGPGNVDRPPDAVDLNVVQRSLHVALLDYRGEVLAAAPVQPDFFSSSQEWGSFVVRMRYVEHVNSVRLVATRGQVVGTLEVPTCRPYFTLLKPGHDSFIDSQGVLHLHWADHDSQHPLTYYVRYSHNGTDWVRPGVNLRGSDYYLDLREMPGGPHCVVQVLATNGYRTSVVETRPFDVMVKPIDVMLGDTNGPLLFAQGFSLEHGPLTGNQIAWLDAQGHLLARGGTLDVRTLQPGVHEVSVRVLGPGDLTRTQAVGTYEGQTGRRLWPTTL